MNEWTVLKKAAREWHNFLLEGTNGDPSAKALLNAAIKKTGIKCIPCPAGDSLLMGAEAVLDQEAKLIFYNEDIDKDMASFYQMHEFAHLQLKHEGYFCDKDGLNPEASEEEIPLGLSRVETYNSKVKIEREANIFAREALLPSNKLRDWFQKEGKKASDIANWLGIPEGMVFHQLSYALLVSDMVFEPEVLENDNITFNLNDSQREAAEWTETNPLLVEAGPGTGKTRTLIARAEFLLKQGIPPSSLLALTFSNKAAEEMRSRLAIAVPEAAPHVWMGTFHAFGLEFLRKYGAKIGIKPNFEVLDPVDAIFLLESKLAALNLDYYRNLYDPTMFLPDILTNISRAKDELVGPDKYMELAKAMRVSANTDEEEIAAEKAFEIANVYTFYQKYIEDNSILDFGDLIFRSVILLQNNPEVKEEFKREYTNILVDEYQDVNRASGVLLKEITAENIALWVVGDTRQSIYRFRGAAPSNVKMFEKDFPGARTKNLDVNHRSQPNVLKVYSELAPKMLATIGKPFIPWKPYHKNKEGTAKLAITNDLDSEVKAISYEIKLLTKKGVPFRNQAILCRTHGTMEKIAILLEKEGIPIFYLGDIFERDEIRDLLSLISLACEDEGSGLVRVARFPEYEIPVADVLALLKYAKEQKKVFPDVLELVGEVDGISKAGKRGLELIRDHLDNIYFKETAWKLLADYLFNRSDFLVPLLKHDTLNTRQMRLAIYQFLQFTHSVSPRSMFGHKDPKKAILNYIRRLELQGADRILRQVPEWASGLDAVRLLTVHASKGLEFDAIYIPYLCKGNFPLSKQGTRCPLPDGLLDPVIQKDSHSEEEECLFFVALSRARNYLYLSHSRKYGARNRNASEFIEKISGQLIISENDNVTIKSEISTSDKTTPIDSSNLPVFDVQKLDIHMKCPKKYFYENILSLGRKRKDSGYVQFHHCVYGVLRWMGEERSKEKIINKDSALKELEEIWEKSGPNGHPYEEIYMQNAKQMVALAIDRFNQGGKSLPIPEWEITLKNGGVRLVPEFLEEFIDREGSKLTQALRFRTGRRTKSESEKPINAVYQAAMEQEYGNSGRVEIIYLSTGETDPINFNDRMKNSRLNKYDKTISDVSKAIFTPKPKDSRDCPRCPHYFICSTAQNA